MSEPSTTTSSSAEAIPAQAPPSPETGVNAAPRKPSSIRRWAAHLAAWARRRPFLTVTLVAIVALVGIRGKWLGEQARAWYHLRAARAALAKYHTSEGKEHIAKAMLIWPSDPGGLLLATQVARREHLFELAERFLERYKEVKGRDDDYELEMIMLRAARGEVDSVAAICRTYVESKHPKSDLILESLTIGSFHSYQLGMAEMFVNLWQKEQPDNTLALYNLGVLEQFRLHAQEAVEAFRKAIERDPDFDEARLELAEGLLDLTQVREAVAHLEYLEERMPDHSRVLMDLQRAKQMMNDPRAAEKLLDRVLAVEPNNHTALLERAKLILGAEPESVTHEQLLQAERMLERAAQFNRQSLEVHHQWFNCLQRLNKKAEAQAVGIRQKQIEEDHRRMQTITTMELPRHPHDPDLMYEIGEISMRSGAYKEAMRWFHKALTENPDHVKSHRALAGYYQQIGLIGLAQRHWQSAGESITAVTPAKKK
jgi:tetratricopeptide (TPR) repeat protein